MDREKASLQNQIRDTACSLGIKEPINASAELARARAALFAMWTDLQRYHRDHIIQPKLPGFNPTFDDLGFSRAKVAEGLKYGFSAADYDAILAHLSSLAVQSCVARHSIVGDFAIGATVCAWAVPIFKRTLQVAHFIHNHNPEEQIMLNQLPGVCFFFFFRGTIVKTQQQYSPAVAREDGSLSGGGFTAYAVPSYRTFESETVDFSFLVRRAAALPAPAVPAGSVSVTSPAS